MTETGNGPNPETADGRPKILLPRPNIELLNELIQKLADPDTPDELLTIWMNQLETENPELFELIETLRKTFGRGIIGQKEPVAIVLALMSRILNTQLQNNLLKKI